MLQKLKNIYHFIQAVIANVYYGFPSRKLKIIGVTGTDGKTTTTHLIYNILKSAGKKVSMISTVYAKIGNKEYETGLHTTTPDPFLIQKLLSISLKSGDGYFVLETTSHALDQFRVFGVKFTIAVLTNISHEHLDYHKTYENYVRAKARLLLSSKYPVINSDDKSFSLLKRILNTQDKKIYYYGFDHKSDFRYAYLDKVSGFNRYNFLAAYSVASLLNIPDSIIDKSVKSFKLPPGRLEVVYKNNITVMIDFAHTPNAFSVLLPYVRRAYMKNKGKLIHVFGAASQRDSSKRPIMGANSSRFADHIILTEEDCRNEDPLKICNEIAEGIRDKTKFNIIPDRQEAINRAIVQGKINDVILITGKSHEKSLCRGRKEYPWNEHEAVKKAISLKYKP